MIGLLGVLPTPSKVKQAQVLPPSKPAATLPQDTPPNKQQAPKKASTPDLMDFAVADSDSLSNEKCTKTKKKQSASTTKKRQASSSVSNSSRSDSYSSSSKNKVIKIDLSITTDSDGSRSVEKPTSSLSRKKTSPLRSKSPGKRRSKSPRKLKSPARRSRSPLKKPSSLGHSERKVDSFTKNGVSLSATRFGKKDFPAKTHLKIVKLNSANMSALKMSTFSNFVVSF